MQLILLVLISLQVFVARCSITDFWDNRDVDKSTLQCLQQNNYLEEVFVLATLDPTQNQWSTNVRLQEIAQLGTNPQVVLSIANLQGNLTPQLEAQRISKQFKNYPVLKFWINISNFRTPFRPSCGYLRKLSFFLGLYSGRRVGIQTEPLFWEDLFGDSAACPQLGEYDLFLSFNDFRPFGGWESHSYYETYQSVDACGYPGMLVFKS